MNSRDIVERAVWTFVQGALATIGVIPVLTDVAGWQSVGLAAATGGLAALLSFLKTVAQEKLIVPDTRG